MCVCIACDCVCGECVDVCVVRCLTPDFIIMICNPSCLTVLTTRVTNPLREKESQPLHPSDSVCVVACVCKSVRVGVCVSVCVGGGGML